MTNRPLQPAALPGHTPSHSPSEPRTERRLERQPERRPEGQPALCLSALSADWDTAEEARIWHHLQDGASGTRLDARPTRLAVKRGAVVLVRFRSILFPGVVLRPALHCARLRADEHLLMQITATPCGDPLAVGLPERVFARGSLRALAFARPGRLFTASDRVIVRSVAHLATRSTDSIIDVLCDRVLRPRSAGG